MLFERRERKDERNLVTKFCAVHCHVTQIEDALISIIFNVIVIVLFPSRPKSVLLGYCYLPLEIMAISDLTTNSTRIISQHNNRHGTSELS